MVDLYRTIVSWVTYTFEQWFWKDAEIQKPKKDNNNEDEDDQPLSDRRAQFLRKQPSYE